MYLNSTDYEKLITQEALLAILDNNLVLLDEVEKIGIREMKAYLFRYDTAVIFASGKAADFPEIGMYLVDIVLYHLHSRKSSKLIPELRIQRYEDAIKWLKAVKEGDISPEGLPLPLDEDGKPEAINYKLEVTSVYERKNYRY